MEIDFDVMLTHEQPLAWSAGKGLSRNNVPLPGGFGVCLDAPGSTCTSALQCDCFFGETNTGTGVPPVPEDRFIGSLECIQYVPASGGIPAHPDNSASTRNSLIGQATIQTRNSAAVPLDVASYNASGLRFKAAVAGIPANELRLDGVQYDSCPTSLVLDHFFDHVAGGPNFTDLTLVPCGNNFGAQIPGSVTAQFLVYNEFEQRFSTTRAVPCFLNSVLSNIDTPNPLRSIFSWQVAGTVAGQARIRPVGTASTGRGLLGVAVFHGSPLQSAAYNLHQNGSPAFGVGLQPDVITLP
jgi:hypothetical protein